MTAGSTVRRVSVIGAGTVGSQLAFQCALGGVEVTLASRSRETLDRGVAAASKVLRRRVEKGTLTEAGCEAAISRVQTTTSIADAAAQGEFVIEAVAEQLELKREIFGELGRLADAEAILATTSSTICISQLAAATEGPERCINAHFFNPVLVMDLVEVVRGPQTSQETVDRTMAFCTQVGRKPILVQRESYGFIVNRIVFTAIREALRLVDEGAATPEDIDEACVRGLNWPMGPVKLADFIGLDVIRDAWLLGREEMHDDAWTPTPALDQHVDSGELGMKAGRGFFEHSRG